MNCEFACIKQPTIDVIQKKAENKPHF